MSMNPAVQMNRLLSGLKTFYLNLQIKHKLFVSHFLIVLIVCSTSLIAIQITLSIYQGILYHEAAKVLNFSTRSIEDELRQIEKHSYNIITDPEIQQSLDKLNDELPLYEKGKIEVNLTEKLWTFRFERNITTVNLIDGRGNQYTAGNKTIPEEYIQSIVTKAAEKEGSMVFIEPFSGESAIIGAREIRKIRGLSLETLGTLIIRINTVNLIKQLAFDSAGDNENLFILSGTESVYSAEPGLKATVASFVYDGDAGYSVKKIGGKNYFVVHTKSDFTNWLYVNVLPYDRVFQRVLMMRNIVLLIFLLLFLFTIFISMKMARNLTKPIEDLTAKMKRVENGEFAMREEDSTEPERTDEIGALQKDFSIMIRKIDTLIKEDYTKQILIKDAQLRALQAQINPHFLYNALESINWRAKINKQNDISQMVESLGNLLRNAISDQEPLVTLRKEIQLLNDYITIQKVRFGGRLDFTLEIDEIWQELLIPKLTLQPIVENSINYGLEKMLDVCRITVRSTVSPDFLDITVEDNGPGIPPDLLEKLEKGEIKPKGLGIGLQNIDERLKLIYGEQYGITISSKLGKGTRVTIHVPKMRVQDV